MAALSWIGTVRGPGIESGHARFEGAHARAALYHALAEALTEPQPGIQARLLGAVITAAQVLGSAACQRATLTLAELPARDLEALRDRYASLEARPGRPLALYESLHREGRLAGQATWEVEQRYRALGLTPAHGELPDHAGVELAFLGHLAAAEAEAWRAGERRLAARLRAKQRSFLRTHAGAWLPQVGRALAAADDAFYAVVGGLLSEFLSEELTGSKHESRVGLPTLEEPDACTLCGLCVGSCPSGALRVFETEGETGLWLNPVLCVGCRRCARICPEGALSLSSEATATPGAAGVAGRSRHHLLRRSPRAACPHCGRPTVSQAELDAVFARLQADLATQRRLSLCVQCKSWSVEVFGAKA